MAIRFKINVVEELALKGYTSYTILKSADPKVKMAMSVFTKIKNQDTDLSLKTINTLCYLLDKPISDIIEYVPED